MCCHQLTQLGRLEESTNILDLWNGAVAKDIRKVTTGVQLHPVCASWNSCPYQTKEKIVGPIKMYRRAAYPTYLEISLPDTHCNIGGENPTAQNPACIMCRRNFQVSHSPDLTQFLCQKARPLMPYLTSFCVLGIAEPFWKDAVFKVFEWVEFHRYRRNIVFTTNTNGTCLTERTTRSFFEQVDFSDISWSLDAATPETFRKIRRLNALPKIIDNLRRWATLREEFGGRQRHQVSIYNNINLLNVHEMTQMVEMGAEIGVDRMLMLPTYDQAGVVELGELVLGPKNVRIFAEAADKAMRRAEQLGMELQYSKPFDHLPPPRPDLIQLEV